MSAYAFFVKLYKPGNPPLHDRDGWEIHNEPIRRDMEEPITRLQRCISSIQLEKYVKLAQDDKLRFQEQMKAWMAQ